MSLSLFVRVVFVGIICVVAIIEVVVEGIVGILVVGDVEIVFVLLLL